MKENLSTVFRFASTSAASVVLKIALTLVFQTHLDPYISYACTHIVIIFFSYYVHAKHTFRQELSGSGFWNYTKTVIGLKVADFLLFSVILKALGLNVAIVIAVISIIMFTIRFFLLRKFVFEGSQKRNG